MNRIIDWFRKLEIMRKLFSTGGAFDGDFVTYKHHKYYVNAQTGTVIRVEQFSCIYIYILQNFKPNPFRFIDIGRCRAYNKVHIC